MTGRQAPPNETTDTSQTIINGTLALMAEEGIANLTTRAISERAEVSTASIHYFFDTKDRLIYEAFRYMIKSLRSEILIARKAEIDPYQRLVQSIKVNFYSEHLSEDAAAIWPQLWVYSGYDKDAHRLLKIHSSRRQSNFASDLRAIGLDQDQARHLAIKINALIQGLWVEGRLSKSTSQEEGWKILESELVRLLPHN